MSETSPGKSGMFQGASPKLTFSFGLVLGIAVFAAIGFFTLLGGGGASSDASTTAKNTNTAAAVVANTNTAAAVAVPEDVPAAPTINADDVKVTDADHIRGTGDVTLVEFSDFECPYCGQVAPTMAQIMKDYDGKVRQVYKHFPLSFHPEARPAALASECAAEQGKFWEFHDQMFANQKGLSATFYPKVAGDLGLNVDTFNKCISDNKYSQDIADDESLGGKIGVQGTPATVLIGKDGSAQMISGALPYAQFKTAIDAALGS
ncbi:MAG: hypothetical protein A3F54_05030 [Candidatus Kerfeldbacteria bacterium RIFCSPHIGHO2_12_FULL_48_17]|uniref:Thioredoxin domain-containing protein n=1 Tax=Candidatus Kerfeldbacteria bacterium RIFCSPHIGHO2_12_FULL_48_17 TaxID=1798542 RepID=A0A1G2B650_9BACT|nr:MAG: hypothetical protein A3F54_05030 [Candidatus Kerfeldbacteria bacterium RIFCSPHIGHO2_12_FULL_48_17]